MREGEQCVGDLEAAIDVHQPTLSQQLGVLRRQGLVSTRRSGKRIYYAVADRGVLRMLDMLHALYCDTH
jgi:ArsR family transcriptional regulator